MIVALLASPLVGQASLAPLADELRRRGARALVAVPEDTAPDAPWHRRHVRSLLATIREHDPAEPVVLVPHSGAGPLAGLVAQEHDATAGLVFLDAGLPAEDESRLDQLADEAPEIAAELEALLAAGGRYPTWSDEDLTPLVADPELRAEILREVRPRDHAFFADVIPASHRWRPLPCAYVLVSPSYTAPAGQARAAGWPTRTLDGGHFVAATDPSRVADALLDLLDELALS